MYGWRAKIGALLVAPDTTPEYEFIKMVPDGVSVHFSRMWFSGEVNAETLARLADEAEGASKMLAPLKPDVVCFCCTSGSFVKGVGYDEEIIQRIEHKVDSRATTTSTAVCKALEKLKLKKIAIATPYTNHINGIAKKFFEDHGYDVLNISGLGISDDLDIGRLQPGAAYQVAKSVDSSEAEGIFISCTNFRTIEILEKLEHDLGKPVISSNQATVWDALRRVGVREAINGFGKLLREP
jgi:maleate isomerase